MDNYKSSIFERFNAELDKIIEDKESLNQNDFNEWKNRLLENINGSYKIKIKKLNLLSQTYLNKEIDLHQVKSIKCILRDMYIKYNTIGNQTKKNIEIRKLLEARDGNIDFEIELAEMITGDNKNFPYRSSYFLTKFFQDLGHDFNHNGDTRKLWVRDMLEELNIIDIYSLLISPYGLFNRKDFKKYIDTLDSEHSISYFLKEAEKEFEQFIKDSIEKEKPLNLSKVLDMNINVELLFENKATTQDYELNKLIEDAKERYGSNDKQVAIEKLWDAFERLKTHFIDTNIESNKKKQKDKKKSVEQLVKIVGNDFDKDFIDNEFKNLSSIGNNYRIRHHEVGKEELTSQHINYFFFRMLSLIDLCLHYLNEKQENNFNV